MSFRTGLSEASVARVFERAPCALDIRRENDSNTGLASYVWTLDFGEGVFVVMQGPTNIISISYQWTNVDGDGQNRYIIRFGTQFDMFVRSQSNIRLNMVFKFNLPITGEIVKVVYSSNFELKLCCQVVCLLTQGFDDVRQGRKGAASHSVDAPGRRLPGIHVQPVHRR